MNRREIALYAFCERKLKTMYPAGIPEVAIERMKEEWQQMMKSGKGEDCYMFRAIAEEAQRLGHPLNLRGAGNASLLVFLLHDSALNPLPAHYYCEGCGHYEEISDVFFGLDAKDKPCPDCGGRMRGRGFDLPQALAWGQKGGLDLSEFSCSMNEKTIFCLLQRLYGSRATRLAERIQDEKGKDYFTLDGVLKRYLILPEGKRPADYPQWTVKCRGRKKALYAPSEELEAAGVRQLRQLPWRGYSLGKHSRETLRGVKPMTELIDALKGKVTLADLFEELEKGMGREYKSYRAWQKLQANPPASWYELTERICLEYSSWIRPYGEKQPAFSSREALYHLLVREGIEGHDAFRICDFIRMGKAADPKHGTEWKQTLSVFPVLESLRTDAENCLYLWSQAAVLPNLLDAIACAGRKTI